MAYISNRRYNADEVRKQKKREYNKEYSEKNKDKKREYDKEYNEKNKAKIKEYRENNRDEINRKQKEYSEKNKDKRKKYSKEYYEKPENKAKIKEYYEKNKDKKKEYGKEYREKNKDKKKEYDKEYKKKPENKDKRNKRRRNRYKIDNQYRISRKIRRQVLQGMKMYSKNGKTKSLVKYEIGIKKIYEHLGDEPEGDYHIDHIFPIVAFDLNNEEHIRLCWHPNNLQWLTKKENLEKGDKYDKREFKEYILKGDKYDFEGYILN